VDRPAKSNFRNTCGFFANYVRGWLGKSPVKLCASSYDFAKCAAVVAILEVHHLLFNRLTLNLSHWIMWILQITLDPNIFPQIAMLTLGFHAQRLYQSSHTHLAYYRRISRDPDHAGDFGHNGYFAQFVRGMRRRDTGEVMELLNAVFENGSFRPETPVELPEGTRVRIAVERVASALRHPALSIEERRRIRQGMVELMMRNPIPSGSPRFTRDELHDRR
jgi:predicted DNA-binding antitoxin AbrB/MazE fold protein